MYAQKYHKLLTRDEFRNQIFDRDKICINCGQTGVDCHHIIERRLWENQGYFLENGILLCSDCHLSAEMTLLSCEELRKLGNIKEIIIPESLEDEYGMMYDKWGNSLLANGTRLKGPLFNDLSVQKILKQGNVLHLFTDYVHYPRTYHLPWSESIGDSDRVLSNIDNFINKEIIVTQKRDGENTTLYEDYYHARSINSGDHPSRHWLKALHSQIKLDIPKGWRICGENLFAKHSIQYNNLNSYFEVFSIWDDTNTMLSWYETEIYAELLGLKTVPILYSGVFDIDLVKNLYSPIGSDGDEIEGYVLRLEDKIKYSQFKNSVGKFVRRNHIQTPHNWKNLAIVKNLLKTH